MKPSAFNVLKDIETVQNAYEKSRLLPVKTPELTAALANLTGRFSITESQAILLCAVTGYYFEENEATCEYRNIARFFDVPVMQILLRAHDIAALKSLGYLEQDEACTSGQPGSIRRQRGMSLTISSRFVNMLLADRPAAAKQPEQRIDDEHYISPERITEKQLLFAADFTAKIDELGEYLDEQNLAAIRKRLSEKKLGTGLTILFCGESGTGKTEAVYQLARAAGRGIYQVDIAAVKSAWFGDSEKAVRAVFSSYRSCCEKARDAGLPLPILLFNEADAVFQRRNVVSAEHGTSRTENAMQNILLEELECINGIMIATTNLPENLDPAFFRRFLFKLQFELPDRNTAAAIWRSKLPWLDEPTAAALAQQYTFSGGIIDNIARRAAIFETVRGRLPEPAQLRRYCSEETAAVFSAASLYCVC